VEIEKVQQARYQMNGQVSKYLILISLISFYSHNLKFVYLHNLIVSYHGTEKHNCKSIAEEGYLLCKGKRFAFGHGIYSTPDIDVALLYADQFSHEGNNYRVVIQNRVNPNNLVRISKQENGVGEYWISPDGTYLRPYGFCIRKDN
jgi:hypothetical protein